MYSDAVYKGSFTWSWNDNSPSSTAAIGANTYIRFNAVKLEALSCFDLTTGFPTNPLPSPLFVVVNEISPISFEYVKGTNLKPIGGVQWGGGAYLSVTDNLCPMKMTSDRLDMLRGQLTFTIYGADGIPILTTGPSYKAVTISFWEVKCPVSSTS